MYSQAIRSAGKDVKMKKYLFAVLCSVFVWGTAFAATNRAVTIGGAMASLFSLEVPKPFSGTMDDSIANEWKIGIVKVISNQKNWTISLTSANEGYLVLATAGGSYDREEKVPYKVFLGDLTPKSGASLSMPWTSEKQPRTPKSGLELGLEVTFGPSSTFWQAGTYADTITVTITAEGGIVPPPGGGGWGGGDTTPVEPPQDS